MAIRVHGHARTTLPGKLTEALHGAASQAQAEIEHLMRYQGYQEHEAREVALSLFILLKPDRGADMAFPS